MKENIIKFNTNSDNIKTDGNLAFKNTNLTAEKYEKPKVLKLVIGKKENKIFCGCWQVANQQDAC